jgi:hypothetical protein
MSFNSTLKRAKNGQKSNFEYQKSGFKNPDLHALI